MSSINEFKNKLKELMKVKKELAPNTGGAGVVLFDEEDKPSDDAELDKLDQELSSEENKDQPADDSSNSKDNTEKKDEPENDSSESPEATETQKDQPTQSTQTDIQKVQTMFKDTGNPSVDYSLTNENNVRMYKFKFTYAGINVDSLMRNDQEKMAGLSRKELESRLSPEQLQYYNEKWQKLREKYPQIAEREKNITIHNSNIMLSVNNEEGEEIPLKEEKKLEAYKKIKTMMDTKFGNYWQDIPEALNFLKNIKINFSNKNPVRTNLLSVKVIQEKDKINGGTIIPFNKIYVDVPQSVQNFLRINQDNQFYNNSSIFQSLSSDFKNADRSVGSIDAIIKGTPVQDKEESSDDQDSEDVSGDSSGGGSFGGGVSSDMGGGAAAPTMGDSTNDNNADSNEETTGEDTGNDKEVDSTEDSNNKTDSVL